MDIWVVLICDSLSGCYGSTQPMNEKECDRFIEDAISNGYDVCPVCLNDLFNFGHQDLDVHRCK